MLSEFLQAAQTEVANHSIYVWGGSGQLCKDVTEAWIRQKERGRMPEAAVKEWEDVMSSPYADVARCFDCSGYVSWCLNQCKAFEGRTDCDGLFARCTEVYTPENGCLLFRVNPSDPKDETHVGIYFDGMQYHAKGRAVGVIVEPYNERYWQRIAWFKKMERDTPVPPVPTLQKVLVKGNVRVRDADSVAGKKLFTAHKGQKFDLIDIAPSGWYHIITTYPDAYITSKPRYTELCTE